jgi:hypothetical protein
VCFAPFAYAHHEVEAARVIPPQCISILHGSMALKTGISPEVNGLCLPSLRATAATNAPSHWADIAEMQEWLVTLKSPLRGSMIDAKRAS